jgi:hypothetical protein
VLPANLQCGERDETSVQRLGLHQATYRCREISELAEPMSVLQAEDLESIRDHNTLLLVVGSWDTLKALETLQSTVSSLRLVGHHSVREERRHQNLIQHWYRR